MSTQISSVVECRLDLLRYWRMSKGILLVIIAGSLTASALTGDPCPITLLSGTGDANSIAVTFQNMGKLPIRQLEFNCIPLQLKAYRARPGACREANALFFPGMQYTVNYPYPRGIPERIRVSVKSIRVSNGYVWRPSRTQSCGVLKINPKKDH